MTSFIDIKPGQWVLAFQDPYQPFDRELPEHLEMFAHRGGGWDDHRVTEIFHVSQVKTVGPKTYMVDPASIDPRQYVKARQARSSVIAAGDRQAEMIALRDRFFSIGDSADDQVEFVIERLARPIRRRVEKKAIKEIHKLLPQHFGRPS